MSENFLNDQLFSNFEKSEKIQKLMPPTLREMFIATKKQEIERV